MDSWDFLYQEWYNTSYTMEKTPQYGSRLGIISRFHFNRGNNVHKTIWIAKNNSTFANRRDKQATNLDRKKNYQTGYIFPNIRMIVRGRWWNFTAIRFDCLNELCREQYHPKSHGKIILIQWHDHVNGLQIQKERKKLHEQFMQKLNATRNLDPKKTKTCLKPTSWTRIQNKHRMEQVFTDVT